MTMFYTPDLKSWSAPTLGLRRFKVSSAVVYALFILVIYSHAALARWQFTLRRSYLKVAGRENAARIYTEVAWDRADRGLCSLRRPWIMGPTREGRKENGRWRAGEKKKKENSTERRERPRVFSRSSATAVYGLSARNIKSRGEHRAYTYGGYFTILKCRDRGKAAASQWHRRFRSCCRVSFPPIPDLKLAWQNYTKRKSEYISLIKIISKMFLKSRHNNTSMLDKLYTRAKKTRRPRYVPLFIMYNRFPR